jgi:hypothetical protein
LGIRHVDKVLQLLKVSLEKEVEYLGHIVSHEGVKVDPNKIKAMMDWPIPKTLKNIRGCLGLTGYKFFRHYDNSTFKNTN